MTIYVARKKRIFRVVRNSKGGLVYTGLVFEAQTADKARGLASRWNIDFCCL